MWFPVFYNRILFIFNCCLTDTGGGGQAVLSGLVYHPFLFALS